MFFSFSRISYNTAKNNSIWENKSDDKEPMRPVAEVKWRVHLGGGKRISLESNYVSNWTIK